jgi:hypothetical protein
VSADSCREQAKLSWAKANVSAELSLPKMDDQLHLTATKERTHARCKKCHKWASFVAAVGNLTMTISRLVVSCFFDPLADGGAPIITETIGLFKWQSVALPGPRSICRRETAKN